MITMIARMKVPPENAAAYERLMTEVTHTTLANEPGVKYYAWAKSADEPDTYVVVEVYEDEHAQSAHMATEWVRNSIPKTQALVDGGFEIRQYVSPGQEPVRLMHG
ncbi:MAG: antibiotic biosynthesis monooxygenase [Novosphingobium sp.]|nr:antibiotic biosynthesis monooxygenase [Novosphingobium sp.]